MACDVSPIWCRDNGNGHYLHTFGLNCPISKLLTCIHEFMLDFVMNLSDKDIKQTIAVNLHAVERLVMLGGDDSAPRIGQSTLHP